MKNTIVALVAGLIIFAGGVYYFTNQDPEQSQEPIVSESNESQEQIVLGQTLKLSQEYAALRYRTDNVLVNAKAYADYDVWNNDMTDIINAWSKLEQDTITLEQLASEMAKEKVSYNFIPKTFAYNKEEITNIVDKAPAGKKIMTLANHLGVDAKMAQLILNQSQDEMSSEAYREEGDVFQKCENQAIVVKNASKITVFVGTIALTGGTAALASGSTLAQAAVVVSGADLTLEITDDAAKMALGDKNKISAIVGDARKITEPAAAILMVSTLPSNMIKGIDKLNAVIFGADQLNGTIQSGSVIGIKLPTPTKEKPEPATEVSVLEKEEVDEWMKEQGVQDSLGTVEEIESILEVSKSVEPVDVTEISTQTEEDKTNTDTQKEQPINGNDAEVVGLWKGILKYTPSQTASENQIEFMIELNNDGTVSALGNGEAFSTWKKEGNAIKLYYKDGSGSYYEFALSGNTLTFIKLAGPNSEGQWQEDFAGEDFFGGKFYKISLTKY